MRYNSVSLAKQEPGKGRQLDKKIDNHFLYHMSKEDKKVLLSERYNNREISPASKSSLDGYLEKQQERIGQSVLYSTFNAESREKNKEMGGVFQRERIARKLQNSSRQN